MSWAAPYILKLQQGQTVSFRPRGHSMRPHIQSGQLVTVQPFAKGQAPEVSDIVLARVRGADYLHFVQARRDNQVLIANAHGHQNGWTSLERVYGKVIAVEA